MLNSLIGAGRFQINGQDLTSLLRNGGLLVAGDALTRLYEYMSKTELGPNGYLYMIAVSGALDMVRRFAKDNTKPKAKK